MSSRRKGKGAASLATAMVPPRSKRKRGETEKLEEAKRTSRFLKKPSKAVQERIERAYSHRLYLIDRQSLDNDSGKTPSSLEFHVLGATGNVYTVSVSENPQCNCPDSRMRGNICKHRLFVMLRVLHLAKDDPRIWQKSLLASEVEDLVNISSKAEPASGLLAGASVRQQFAHVHGESSQSGVEAGGPQKKLEGDCPICYEALANEDGMPAEEVVFCKTCGNNVHKECFARWRTQKTGQAVTCVYCRSPWQENQTKSNTVPGYPGTYLNLAAYSEVHVHGAATLKELYPDTHERICGGERTASRRGRGRK